MINPTVSPAVELDRVSLRHKIDFTPASARRFAARCEAHGVDNCRLREMVRKIDKFIPPMNFGMCNGTPNPNNGRPHHWYTIGKEYSRVLYVNIAKAYLRDSDKLCARIGNFLYQISEDYGADEFGIVEDTPDSFVARFWWD